MSELSDTSLAWIGEMNEEFPHVDKGFEAGTITTLGSGTVETATPQEPHLVNIVAAPCPSPRHHSEVRHHRFTATIGNMGMYWYLQGA